MQIVIELPDELYKAYKDQPPCLGDAGMDMIAQSIAKGTTIPKGHGRLIDESDIEWAKFKVESKYFEYDELVNWIDVKNAPTIIPEDKEE